MSLSRGHRGSVAAGSLALRSSPRLPALFPRRVLPAVERVPGEQRRRLLKEAIIARTLRFALSPFPSGTGFELLNVPRQPDIPDTTALRGPQTSARPLASLLVRSDCAFGLQR